MTPEALAENAIAAHDQPLPQNMTFSYAQIDDGTFYVSLYGFTAGPPATVTSPALLTLGYNPATFFNGLALGAMYSAHAMAFLQPQKLYFQGWIASAEAGWAPEYVSYAFDV